MKLLVLLAALLVSLCGCGKPRGDLDHYLNAKAVVNRADMRPLEEKLLQEDVAGFNRLRTQPPYVGKRLDFRGDVFAGLTLDGADFSDSILARVDFSGARLNGASFRGSYLATMWLALPHSLATNVPVNVGRPASVAKADFSGAVVEANEYDQDSENFGAWFRYKSALVGLGQTDYSQAIGLGPLTPALVSFGGQTCPFRITGQSKTILMPGGPMPVRPASALGSPCPNPFREADLRAFEIPEATGIAVNSFTNLSAVGIHGQYYGANMINVINDDPSVVLVVGPDFEGHGDIYSRGPVVIDGAHLMGNVFAEGPIWLRHRACPRGNVAGQFVFAETTTDGSQGHSWLCPVKRIPPVPSVSSLHE